MFLFIQDLSAIQKKKNPEEESGNFETLRNHLLALAAADSRLNVLKEGKAALAGDKSQPNVTSPGDQLVTVAEASELTEIQQEQLMDTLQV